MMNHFLSFILICLFSFSSLFAQADSTKGLGGLFQGKITFIHQVLNPNKALISDEEFYRDISDGGKSTVILYLRGNQYKWEYPERVEVYMPQQQQVAIYLKNKTDSIYYAPASVVEDPLEKIEKSAMTKSLLGYDLSAYSIKTKWDTRTFLYSPLVLKTNPSYWKNHKREYLSDIIAKSGGFFPMMIHQKSLLGNWIMAVSKIEPMPLTDEIFQVPRK